MLSKIYHIIEQFGFSRTIGLLFIVLGIDTICFTLVMQFGLGVQPCLLCYLQRIPFLTAGVMGIFLYRKTISFKAKQILTYILTALFAINTGIAGYNIGIEHKWWEGTKACKGNIGPISFDDMQNAFSPSLIRLADCSVIQWSLFGHNIFTLAFINLIASSFLCGFCLVIIKKKLLNR